jgi:serine/threonine-protein kinase
VAQGHAVGVAPADLAPGELVPIREVIDAPGPPLVPALAALVLLVVTVAVALIGLGPPPVTATVPRGAVLVAGADVAGGGPVAVDLAQPVEIAVGVLPSDAVGVDAVQLQFSVGGVPLPASGVGFVPASDGLRRIIVEATSARFLAAGEATGEVVLYAGNDVEARSQFLVEPEGSPFLTIPGAVTVLLLLFLLAYAESRLRPLRSGRKHGRGIGGVVIIGAALGATLVLLGWMLGAPEPRARTVVICAMFGAGAGMAAALAARQAGQRHLLKRAA